MVNPPTSQYAENWRHPLSRQDWLDARFYQDLGRTLERGCFDMLFLPDSLAVPEDQNGSYDTTLRTGGKGSIYLDPMITLGIVAGATSHLGLGATISTTFAPAYDIARSMPTLDHLSGGRAAWNIVTSTTDAEARNFGLEAIPDKTTRYDYADRVTQTVVDLWKTWQIDALTLDAEARLFADPSKVSRIPADHGGPRSAADRSRCRVARRGSLCSCRQDRPHAASSSRHAGPRWSLPSPTPLRPCTSCTGTASPRGLSWAQPERSRLSRGHATRAGGNDIRCPRCRWRS